MFWKMQITCKHAERQPLLGAGSDVRIVPISYYFVQLVTGGDLFNYIHKHRFLSDAEAKCEYHRLRILDSIWLTLI